MSSVAAKLFHSEGIRAVSVDEIAAKAGLTKRTIYYHFRSKDDLIAACLETRDQPNLALFKKWFADTEGGVADKVQGIFRNLARYRTPPQMEGLRLPAHLGRADQPAGPSRHHGRTRAQEAGRGLAVLDLRAIMPGV